MTNLITWASLAIIAIVFLLFVKEVRKLHSANAQIKKALEGDDIIESFKETKMESLSETYKKSINIKTQDGIKTNTPSAYFFTDDNVAKSQKLNLHMLDSASGTLVGLGLLGTFLGLTVGIAGFDSSNSDNIQQSIQSLLGGMGTAFSTSLLGMLCSLIYTAIDKTQRNKLQKNIYSVTERLDEAYYIDDNELQEMNQKALMEKMLQRISSELSAHLMYTNETGERVVVANAVREILTENEEQSKALKSFSTDLALELNNGFDEVLSRLMQQKILPLMENVDATTRSIVEHIDQMAAQVSSPATDMIQNVVTELKSSMTSIVDEFKSGLSNSATNELETLASQLGTASQAMADFPKNMENISSTLQVTIEEIKAAISEISNTSANANSTAMQKMQEQITFATGAISSAIAEVKDVMGSITQTSQEQSNQIVSKLSDAAEKMGAFLNGTIAGLSASVQESIKNITDDVNNKQADLIALQEDTTTQTKKLLETFNQGLDRLEKMNDYISSTMDMFKQAQGQITGSTAHLQIITGDMKTATQLVQQEPNRIFDEDGGNAAQQPAWHRCCYRTSKEYGQYVG